MLYPLWAGMTFRGDIDRHSKRRKKYQCVPQTTIFGVDGAISLAVIEAPRPKRQRMAVFTPGGVAGQTPSAYSVHNGSGPVEGVSEENNECP